VPSRALRVRRGGGRHGRDARPLRAPRVARRRTRPSCWSESRARARSSSRAPSTTRARGAKGRSPCSDCRRSGRRRSSNPSCSGSSEGRSRRGHDRQGIFEQAHAGRSSSMRSASSARPQPKLLRARVASVSTLGSNVWHRSTPGSSRDAPDLAARMQTGHFGRTLLPTRRARCARASSPRATRRHRALGGALPSPFKRSSHGARLPPGSLAMLRTHDWPGNVPRAPERARAHGGVPRCSRELGRRHERGREGSLLQLPLRDARQQVIEQFEQTYIASQLKRTAATSARRGGRRVCASSCTGSWSAIASARRRRIGARAGLRAPGEERFREPRCHPRMTVETRGFHHGCLRELRKPHFSRTWRVERCAPWRTRCSCAPRETDHDHLASRNEPVEARPLVLAALFAGCGTAAGRRGASSGSEALSLACEVAASARSRASTSPSTKKLQLARSARRVRICAHLGWHRLHGPDVRAELGGHEGRRCLARRLPVLRAGEDEVGRRTSSSTASAGSRWATCPSLDWK